MKKTLFALAAIALLFFCTMAGAAEIDYGSGPPSAAIGRTGSFYFDIVTRQIYGPRGTEGWQTLDRMYDYTVDYLVNVPAADPDKIVDNQDTVDGALTGTDANPLFARNLSFAITDADTSIDAYTLTIVGTNQFNEPVTEVFNFDDDGLTGVTEAAFLTVTSATFADLNGVTEDTDKIDIGTSVKVGLSQKLGDNGADTGVYRLVVGTTITAIPTVDADTGTIDLTDSAPNGTNDYTIYMKALR